MKTNKILILIITTLFLMTIITAIDTPPATYVGKQGESVSIVETCAVRGFPCPADYLCNITISDPNLEVLILNEPMTRNDTIYNYTFTSTTLLGDYDINVYCGNLTFSGNAESDLRVTTTGREPQFKITLFLLICALVIFVLALYMKNYAIGFTSGILFLVGGVHFMVYGLQDISDMYTRAISLVIIAFGGFVTLVAGLEWLDELEY